VNADRSTTPRGPGRLRRLVFRSPFLLERIVGRAFERAATWAMGIEWIALETRGRRSGRLHTVMLDVVGHDVDRDTYYVQPAYGRHAAWVLNVTAHPDVIARVGERRFAARVRDASGAEGAEVVLRFVRAHPWYARVIVWFVGYADRIDRGDEELRRELTDTPVFAIEAKM
jgi:deazaflavin-dependent oxidoreductase (nitroreductase family)